MRVIAEVVKAVDDVDLSVGALKFHLLGDYIGLLWLKPTAQKCHCKYSNVIVILVSLMANLSDITQSNRYSSISTNSTRQNFVSLGLGYFCIPNFGISLT